MADLTGMLQAAAGSGGSGPVSNPWNVSTAVYNGTPINFFFVGAQEALSQGLFFKPDGTKMYVVGSIGDAVYEYDLSSAWDISTAVFLQSFSVVAEERISTGVFFKPDGTKMYVIGSDGDAVWSYDL